MKKLKPYFETFYTHTHIQMASLINFPKYLRKK